MDTSEATVVVAGAAAVCFVLWYFFGPRRATAATVSGSGAQEITITVKGGYSPDMVVVRAGRPVRLNFYRDETASCSEEVIFSDFGIAKRLPAFKTTSVEFTPEKPGEYTFTCGMNMMRGKVLVEAPGSAANAGSTA